VSDRNFLAVIITGPYRGDTNDLFVALVPLSPVRVPYSLVSRISRSVGRYVSDPRHGLVPARFDTMNLKSVRQFRIVGVGSYRASTVAVKSTNSSQIVSGQCGSDSTQVVHLYWFAAVWCSSDDGDVALSGTQTEAMAFLTSSRVVASLTSAFH
jgi:hypothetical protein